MKSLDSDIKFYGGRFLTALPMAAVVGRKDIIPLPYKEQRHSDRREESHTPTSRKDGALITVGFNLRQESYAPQVPRRRHFVKHSINQLFNQSINCSKSRRDNTLITAGFNLRHKSNAPQVPQGRHLGIDNVPSLRDLMLPSVRFRRLKPTVNNVPSLRDLVMTLNY